jgi:dTDP-4-dehydrorhamnose 3,5-epimerase
MLIPSGFAHGFCVQSEEALFEYKCSNFYSPKDDRGILWNDPKIKIPWPIKELGMEPILSPKDLKLPLLSEQPDLFD